MKLTSASDAGIWAAANPIMDNIMDASTARDHARHVRDFTDRLKAIVTPEHLDRICERYQREWGRLSQREPVAIFRREKSLALVWRQYCDKTDDEFVAEMVLIDVDGALKVDHVVFF